MVQFRIGNAEEIYQLLQEHRNRIRQRKTLEEDLTTHPFERNPELILALQHSPGLYLSSTVALPSPWNELITHIISHDGTVYRGRGECSVSLFSLQKELDTPLSAALSSKGAIPSGDHYFFADQKSGDILFTVMKNSPLRYSIIFGEGGAITRKVSDLASLETDLNSLANIIETIVNAGSPEAAKLNLKYALCLR